MISSAAGPTAASPTTTRSVQVAVHDLQQALAQIDASLTIQEGLYRAYLAHLRDLDAVDGMPPDLRGAIHALLIDLRSAFGFDESTGTKIAPSTLDRGHAILLLARLKAIASRAKELATETRPPT